ncbi:MAG: ATP synthase F1 subunit gamma [Planctomycetota bacterium]|jgi:F-type H+-transporting ATPase subunit gamma
MANIKELRGRIKSVTNIAKITKAMEMVASMKLRKVQNRALSHGPYTRTLYGIMEHLARHVGQDGGRPLFQAREVKTIGVLLVTSDRGLCGAYNANVTAQVTRLARQLEADGKGVRLKFYVIGRKGYTWLGRRGYEVVRFYAEPALEQLDFKMARIASDDLVAAFLAGEVDRVLVMSTAFRTASRFEPTTVPFLPLSSLTPEHDTSFAASGHGDGQEGKAGLNYLLEPDVDSMFDAIVPKYLQTVVFDSMLESLASEMASRRMAMKGATDAASRMGKELRKKYNRARQESITKELLDIVGGASAVS